MEKMSRHYSPWSEAEERQIWEMYMRNYQFKSIGTIVGRTRVAVMKKIYEIKAEKRKRMAEKRKEAEYGTE